MERQTLYDSTDQGSSVIKFTETESIRGGLRGLGECGCVTGMDGASDSSDVTALHTDGACLLREAAMVKGKDMGRVLNTSGGHTDDRTDCYTAALLQWHLTSGRVERLRAEHAAENRTEP